MTTFNELGLAEPLLKAISETGYETPTPIQLQAIPPVRDGKDVLGIAQTGTGKTAAFALPILHRLAADRRPTPRRGTRTLVLSPTRELATQIAESFRTYGKHLGFSVTTIFGGVSERPQTDRLSRGVDILVATPGRLLDHLSQRNLALDMVEIFVLDEADQMLDLGFFKPIRRIVSHLPKVRQNLFFSATMPKEIEELTRELLHSPVKIAVAPESTTVERVGQRVLLIEQNKKKALLTELLADTAMQRTLVFTRTKRGADRVAKHLCSSSINAAAIHGNKSQNQREAALASFREGKVRVLVATDIAARGIDIDEVTHVVNYELPEVPEAYVHRIGRTARAGASGAAISFCDGGERHLLTDIERVTRQKIDSIDRRNDAGLASDRPGNDHSSTPRGASQRSGSGRGRPERGDAPSRDGRPARAPRGGERSGGDRSAGPRSGGERSPSERRFSDRQERPSFGAPRGDASRPREGARAGGREGDRDAVWSNRGDRPDRQHREERPDRPDRAPRPARFGDTGADRGPDRREGGAQRPAFRDDRGSERRPERNEVRRDDRRDDRPSGPPRERSGDRPQHASRPSGGRPGGDRGGERRPSNGFKPREDRGGDRRDGAPRPSGDRPQGARPQSAAPFRGNRDGQRSDANRGESRGRDSRPPQGGDRTSGDRSRPRPAAQGRPQSGADRHRD